MEVLKRRKIDDYCQFVHENSWLQIDLTDSACRGGPDEKIPPFSGTNQIAGFF